MNFKKILNEMPWRSSFPALEIGYPKDPTRLYLLNGENILPYIDDLNLAQYNDPHGIVYDTQRLRLILDTMIDVIEKIEATS